MPGVFDLAGQPLPKIPKKELKPKLGPGTRQRGTGTLQLFCGNFLSEGMGFLRPIVLFISMVVRNVIDGVTQIFGSTAIFPGVPLEEESRRGIQETLIPNLVLRPSAASPSEPHCTWERVRLQSC